MEAGVKAAGFSPGLYWSSRPSRRFWPPLGQMAEPPLSSCAVSDASAPLVEHSGKRAEQGRLL